MPSGEICILAGGLSRGWGGQVRFAPARKNIAAPCAGHCHTNEVAGAGHPARFGGAVRPAGRCLYGFAHHHGGQRAFPGLRHAVCLRRASGETDEVATVKHRRNFHAARRRKSRLSVFARARFAGGSRAGTCFGPAFPASAGKKLSREPVQAIHRPADAY